MAQPYACGNFTTHGNFRAVTCQFGYNATTYPPEYMYRARVPTMEQQDQWNYTLAEMDVPFRDFNGTRLPYHLRLVSPTSEMSRAPLALISFSLLGSPIYSAR